MDGRLVQELRDIVGDAGVVTDSLSRLAYESDGLTLERETPDLVLLPRSTEETARCMRILHREGVPVVPRGAGTGLSGGATPVAGGVTLGLAPVSYTHLRAHET